MDRRLYIHIYGERIRRRIKQTREKHGEINTEEAQRKEREGEGQRWREIKTEREGRRGEWRPSANYLRFPATGAN